MAADDSIPTVWPLFWSFRLMVACGFIMLFVFGAAFVQRVVRRSNRNHGYLKRRCSQSHYLGLRLKQVGFVAEFGRQPWAVGEILPVNVAASALTIEQLWTSLFAILALYAVFLIAEVYLMLKFARKGPSSLKTGPFTASNKTITLLKTKLAVQSKYK